MQGNVMNVANFEIHAMANSICAQRLTLALSPRGASYQWQIPRARERLLVRHPDGKIDSSEEPLAMIEIIETCFADQPFHPRDGERLALHRRLMQATLEAERRLLDVVNARGLGDLDLALHFLFRSLEVIEAGVEAPPRVARQPLSNLDVMLAPVLWRILLLDRRAATYILASLPRLAVRAEWLIGQMEVSELFDQQAAESFIATISQLAVGQPAADGQPTADGQHWVDGQHWTEASGKNSPVQVLPELSLVSPATARISPSKMRTARF
jgi:hypothetical protein